MKRSVLFCLFIFFSTVCSAQSTSADLKQLQWLEGEWNRTNAKPGRSGIKKWITNSPTEMQGWGISLRGTDTAFVEKLKIIVKDNHVYYVADVPQNKGVVLFKLTKTTGNEFVFENPEHDFPKQITYTKEGAKLKASISGNGKVIDYLFEKKL